MAPIRRYLRITKYSVLEVRIYLHKPSDASWLLSSRDNVLQRIIQEVRPKVLPKLREENENARKKGAKGKKKKGIKDVASQEDFEVAIFLKETSTRHSLLTKQKKFSDKPKIKSTSNNLTGWLNNSDHPINITDEAQAPGILREEDEDIVEMQNIPEAPITTKRKTADGDEGADDDALFVSSSDEEFFTTQRAKPSTKRRRLSGCSKEAPDDAPTAEPIGESDDKKKLLLDTSYDGFSIYGRILCLIVTRKGKRDAHPGAPSIGGSQMMEQWVSTQAANELGIGDDDDG